MQRHFKYITLLIFILSLGIAPSSGQDNPAMKQMEKHLDLDGEVLILQSISNLQAQMENTRSMYADGLMKAEDPEAVDFFRSFFNLIPTSLAGIGASGKNANGFFNIKACIATSGEKDALIKAFTPLTPHTQGILQYVPAETMFFYSADFDFHALYQIIENESKNWKSEEAKKGWEDFKKEIEEDENFTAEEIMKGFGKEVAFFLQTSEDLENSEENLCMAMKIANPEFFNEENTKPDEDETMKHVKKDGFDIWYYEKKNPDDGPGNVQAWDGTYLFFCEIEHIIDTIIKAKTTGANLTTNEEFKRLTAGLPEANNGLTYVSGKWNKTLSPMLKKEIESTENIYFDPDPLLQFMMPFLDGMAAVRVSHPDAITWQARLPEGSDKNIVTALFGPSASVGGTGAAVMAVPILGAIAVPNFLEAQNRAKVSRTLADMRTAATGIESYYVDYNKYPDSVVGKESINGNLPETHPAYWMPTFKAVQNNNGERVSQLRHPIAYIIKPEPFDVFAKSGEAYLGYYSPDGRKWTLFSPGPDGDYDIDPEKDLAGDPAEALKKIETLSYDPTNGSISNGDIFRHGGYWK